MGTISKDCAKQLSKNLTEKNKAVWWAAEKNLREAASKIYRSMIPKDVIELFEKKPEWFNTEDSLYLNGNGFNGEYIELELGLPEKHSGPKLQPSAKDCERLRKLFDKAKDLEKEYDKLRKDIENAVLLLRTSKKVVEVFPETADFLNSWFSTKHLPAVINIDSIKQRLA